MKDGRRQRGGGRRAGRRASACSTAGVTALLSAGVAALLTVSGPTAGAETAGGTFDPGENASVLEFVSEADRAGLANALEDAGRNWPELAAALEALDGEQRAACLTLIEDMPHLDRLEMTAATLTEHVSYAFRARDEMPYDVPEEMFGPYILTYRIEEEPAEPWRAELYARFAPVAEREGSVEATARAMNSELAELITEREWGFYGPRQSPLLTLRSGSGSGAEIAVLACAALKAVGIPSRQASVAALGDESGGAHWIEIYGGTDWTPMYPLHPEAFGDFGYPEREHAHNVTVVSSSSAFEQVLVTDRYTDTGTVEFAFVDDGRPAAGFEHFSLSVRNDGALVPLDDLNAVAGDDGRFAADVGDGSYVALAGVRDEAGNPFVMMQEVNIDHGVTIPVAFDVTPRGEAPSPGVDDLSKLQGALTVVAVPLPGQEPSLRMMPLISGAVARRSGAVDLVCGIPDGAEEDLAELRRLAGSSARVITVPRGASSFESLPGVSARVPDNVSAFPLVLVYVTDGGRLVMESSGYDLNVARRLEAALDDALRGLAEGRPAAEN